MNTDSLVTLRAKQSPKSVWRPPRPTDLHHGHILAFDQSLSATGAVLLSHIGDEVRVLAARVVSTPAHPDVKSTRENDIRRALMLRHSLNEWVRTLVRDPFMVVAYEAVPEGPYIRHIESSLLSAMAVKLVCQDNDLRLAEQAAVPARTHKKFTSGNLNASKSEHGKAMKKLGAEMPIEDFGLVTNEATRDALSIALCALRKN